MLFVTLLIAVGVVGAFHPSLALTRKRYDGYKVLSATPADKTGLDLLHHLMISDINIDFWHEPSRVGAEAHLMVAPEHLQRIEAILREAGIDYKTHVDDVQNQLTPMWAAIDRRSIGPEQQVFNINEYNTLDDINAWMQSLVNYCRAGLTCSVYNVGNSVEGRPINVFKISSGAGRKAYWIDASIHGRDWITTATATNILNILATGGDANAVALANAYDWYIMPVLNPDGYAYTWNTDRMWRKNRRVNAGSDCIGTDINRNFDFRWGTDGASFNPCASTFCGDSAGSEPETVAASAELVRLGSSLIGAVTLLSYGNMWLYSWGNTVDFDGVTCDLADDHDELMVVADATANAIQATYGTTWSRGNSCQVKAATSGSTNDYAKGVAGVKYAFIPEVRGNGFDIPNTEIPLSFNEIWNGIVAMCASINA